MLKWIDLRRYPSLELATMFLLSYLPFILAEGINLSGNIDSVSFHGRYRIQDRIDDTSLRFLGIMAILACGIVMSHYTYFNLSPIGQITSQKFFRMIAFMAETIVFLYLGIAVFCFDHSFNLIQIITALVRNQT
jgi:solute carrier family 9 (sodium/hydrogen exchanger), member 8